MKSKEEREAAPLRLPDTWEANALKEIAIAMLEWLDQDKVTWTKPLNKISLRETMGMAWAGMAKYTELRDEKRKAMRLSVFDDEAIDDLGYVIRRGNGSRSGS